MNDLATWLLAGAAGVGRGSPTAVPAGDLFDSQRWFRSLRPAVQLVWWSRSGPRRHVGQCCCRGAPAVKARRAVCEVPSVEGSSAAGLQRCCSKLLLSCDAAGASAAILLNRYRAPPIPQAYKRAFVCSKLRSAQMLRARCPDLLPRTHTATQTHPHACSVYRMRAACLHPARDRMPHVTPRLCPHAPREPWPEPPTIFEIT